MPGAHGWYLDRYGITKEQYFMQTLTATHLETDDFYGQHYTIKT
jgi:hypothetical protein